VRAGAARSWSHTHSSVGAVIFGRSLPGRYSGSRSTSRGDSANAVAARLVLRLPRYRPGKDLPKITAPTLLCVCDDDRAAPARTTVRLASGQDHVQVNRYAADHFDIYVGDLFEHAVADQIAFLAARFEANTP